MYSYPIWLPIAKRPEGIYALTSQPYADVQRHVEEVRDELNARRGGFLAETAKTKLTEIILAFRADAMARVAHTAVSMHRFRAENGHFPDDLSQLTPDITAIIPSDPYDMQHPLKLATTDRGWAVYSIGPDLKDDHGQRWNDVKMHGDLRFVYETPAADQRTGRVQNRTSLNRLFPAQKQPRPDEPAEEESPKSPVTSTGPAALRLNSIDALLRPLNQRRGEAHQIAALATKFH